MAASSSSSSSSRKKKFIKASTAIADAAPWCCAIAVLGLILVSSIRDDRAACDDSSSDLSGTLRGSRFLLRPCDDIYVVGEGETLQTIGDKCGDPFIVERNPHIHDPDDVFPGLVIQITPTKSRKALRRSVT